MRDEFDYETIENDRELACAVKPKSSQLNLYHRTNRLLKEGKTKRTENKSFRTDYTVRVS